MTTKAYPEISQDEINKRLIKILEVYKPEELIEEIPAIEEYFKGVILDEYETDNEHFLDYETVLKMFTDGDDIAAIRIKYNYNDIMLREDFNNYTDGLCKDREISPWAYENWNNPF